MMNHSALFSKMINTTKICIASRNKIIKVNLSSAGPIHHQVIDVHQKKCAERKMDAYEFNEAMKQIRLKQKQNAAEAEKSKHLLWAQVRREYLESLQECRKLVFEAITSNQPTVTLPMMVYDDFHKEMEDHGIFLSSAYDLRWDREIKTGGKIGPASPDSKLVSVCHKFERLPLWLVKLKR